MPTYDYECDACDHRFEEFQSMNDKHLTVCPKCKKSRLRRLIGAGAGIIFKGSGFYSTDYKKGNGSAASEKASEKGKSDAKSADAKPVDTKSSESSAPKASDDKSCGSCGKTGPNVCD